MKREDLARLAGLKSLTEAEFQSRQAGMTRLRLREAAIRETLRTIEADRAEQLAALHPADPAVRAGAVLAWETWVEQRQKGLTLELARLRVEMEAAKDALAQSFGRDHALGGMIDRQRGRVLQQAQRRRDAGA